MARQTTEEIAILTTRSGLDEVKREGHIKDVNTSNEKIIFSFGLHPCEGRYLERRNRVT